MRFLPIALFCCALPLFAQSRDPFPADFTPSPCAPENSCRTLPTSSMPSAAATVSGLRLDPRWIDEHGSVVIDAMGLACRRHATCLATAGNTYWFCDETLGLEVSPICDKLFPQNVSRHDWEQCTWYHDTVLLGIDLHAEALWRSKHECARAAARPHPRPLEFWMVPEKLPLGFSGDLMFYALDPDTHVPALARITFEGQNVLSPANPAGNPVTFFPVPYKLKLVRVPNADGHTDLLPPMITVSSPAYPAAAAAPAYPEIQFRLPAAVPKLVVEMKPAPETFHRGKNRATISTHDAATGKPVEMRVMVGNDAIGNSNTPVTIEIDREGHHPEIWLTSLFNQYSDVVVAKAVDR